MPIVAARSLVAVLSRRGGARQNGLAASESEGLLSVVSLLKIKHHLGLKIANTAQTGFDKCP
ncbi:MAG TPA: hypothetical protein VGN44_04150 [Candidatus Angelobacter sp.]|jgi:hypothetical protein